MGVSIRGVGFTLLLVSVALLVFLFRGVNKNLPRWEIVTTAMLLCVGYYLPSSIF